MASTEASANSYIGCFLSILSKSDMRYAGVLYRIDPQESVIGLANVRSFGTEGRRKDGPQVLPDDRVFDYVNFRGSDIKVLQVLSSEAQPEKVTSDLPDDPAIIQAYLLHSSSASAITPQAATISGPNSSSLGLPNLAVHQSLSSYQPIQNLTSFSSLLSTNALAAGQPMLLRGQEFSRSTGQVPYPQQQLLAGLPPGLAAYHSLQPMQHPVTSSLTMSIAATCGLSDSLKPPVVMDFLTSTPILIPSDLSPALLIPDTLPYVARDSFNSSITSMSSAAKCSSTAGLNISHIPQVFNGANFVQGSGLAPESLAQATLRRNESGSLNHMEDLKPSPTTPCQILQTGAHGRSSYHFSRNAHEDEEVVKFLTSESLPREPTGAQAPILPLPRSYAKKVYKGNLQNHNSIASKLAERGKRHKGAPQYISNHKAYGEGKGEKMRTSNVQNPSYAVSKVAERVKRINRADSCLQITKTKPWERKNRMTRAESRTNQNTSILGKGGKKFQIDRADRQHHQTSKSISVGRGKKIPHLAAKYTEDFDFEALNKKFNEDEVWGELGKQNEAHLKTKARGCDLPAEDAEHVDAAMKLDKKPGYVKDGFFDSLSTGPRKPKISEQRKLDMECTKGAAVAKRRGLVAIPRSFPTE